MRKFTNLDSLIENLDNDTMVFFTTKGCSCCARLKPQLTALAPKYADSFSMICIEFAWGDAIDKKYSIEGTPTLILFHNGGEVCRLVGDYTKNCTRDFMNLAKELIAEDKKGEKKVG